MTEIASQDPLGPCRGCVPQKRISEKMCEQLGVIEVPKKSSQESVEIVKIIPQEQMSERKREQIGVIDVTKISIDVTKIADLDQGWQRTVKQFLDDIRHEPISRIYEWRRILSFLEQMKEKKERRWLQ